MKVQWFSTWGILSDSHAGMKELAANLPEIGSSPVCLAMHPTYWIQNVLIRTRLLPTNSGTLDVFTFCSWTLQATSSCFLHRNACCWPLQIAVISASFHTAGICSEGYKLWPLLHSNDFGICPLLFYEALHFDFCFCQLGCHWVTPHGTLS